MKAEIDKHIEGIYLDILRKMLENPDNWIEGEIYNKRCYSSPYINKDEKLKFLTLSNILSMSRDKSIEIYKDEHKIYELKIPRKEFKIRKLLNKLYDQKQNEEEIKTCQETSNMLKEALGKKMERFIKISKLKKNM